MSLLYVAATGAKGHRLNIKMQIDNVPMIAPREPAGWLSNGSEVPRRWSERLWVTAPLLALWGVAVAFGWYAIGSYGAKAGGSSGPPESWPAQSQVHRTDRFTLLLFLHPMCPCSKASLAQFSKLVAEFHGEVNPHVLFILPVGADDTWQTSGLYKQALEIQDVTVDVDVDRQEAKLFGATTSGGCLLFAPNGKLLFEGGLTIGRGYEGTSEGLHAIGAALKGQDDKRTTAPVFGCPLFEPETPSPTAAAFSD